MSNKFIPHDIINSSSEWKFIPARVPLGTNTALSRGSSVEERGTHNPEVGGATPSPATISPNIILGYN
jgi:hypothetical protein